MFSLGPVNGARLAALATGHGAPPTPLEWPWLVGLLLVVALVGTRVLMLFGLTRLEAVLVAGLAPLLVFVDAPLGNISPTVSLAANVTGCLLPVAVGIKILAERRVPWLEGGVLVCSGIVVSFIASHVVPDRGVMLQYRVPALIIGLMAAALFHSRPEKAGAGAFAAGGIGVVVGADLLHLQVLAHTGGPGRIILGGAGLLDGIFLVAVLGCAVAGSGASLMRSLVALKVRTRPAA